VGCFVAGGREKKGDVPDETEREQLGREVGHEEALRFLRASRVEVAGQVCKGSSENVGKLKGLQV
jgi:hypothetical protein